MGTLKVHGTLAGDPVSLWEPWRSLVTLAVSIGTLTVYRDPGSLWEPWQSLGNLAVYGDRDCQSLWELRIMWVKSQIYLPVRH
jgi:hypothetical protein